MPQTATVVYTSAQAAKLIGIHQRTLYAWLADGLLPEPKRIWRGKVPARLFTDRDLSRGRALKSRNLPFRRR